MDGDLVVVTPGGDKATIVALNRSSGDVAWRSVVPACRRGGVRVGDRRRGRRHETVRPVPRQGTRRRRRKTGKFLRALRPDRPEQPREHPHPGGEGRLRLHAATNRGGGGLVKVNATLGATAEQVYFDKKLPVAIGGSVLVGEHLYGTGQILMCVQFSSGQVKWTDRSVGYAGSILYADGNLYLHGEQTGEMALVEAAPGNTAAAASPRPANPTTAAASSAGLPGGGKWPAVRAGPERDVVLRREGPGAGKRRALVPSSLVGATCGSRVAHGTRR